MVQGVVVEEGHLVDVNPATGEVIARVRCATPEEVTAAIHTARDAQRRWQTVPLGDRIAALKKGCANIAAEQAELARLITREMGKVLSEAEDEAAICADKAEFLDLVMEANQPEKVSGPMGVEAWIVRQPMGVVAVLSPWNFPAGEIPFLALPALAAGNTVIVKPSEVTPLTGARVVELLQAALPAGVLQVVQGDGAVGAALVAGPVDMVAMTGSSATGRRVMAAAAPSLKRLVMELGGKDPMVVFADADMEKAAADAVEYSLMNCGQVCCSVERVYVERGARVDFETRCVELAKNYTTGNGAEPGVRVGPMVSALQRSLVDAHVKEAVAAGARLLYQGPVPDVPGANFYPVTVLSDVRPDMRVAEEETFGPVVAIMEFDGSEEQAVALGNATDYGLSACVYSQDVAKAARVAQGLRTGQVAINAYPLAVAPPKCPWVGAKGSGFGYHSGMDGWRQFSTPKSIIAAGPLPLA